MCKNEKRTHGTAATGVPVAEMLASEARRSRTRGVRGGPRLARTTTPLYAFSRAIDRESHAGLGNSSNNCFFFQHGVRVDLFFFFLFVFLIIR